MFLSIKNTNNRELSQSLLKVCMFPFWTIVHHFKQDTESFLDNNFFDAIFENLSNWVAYYPQVIEFIKCVSSMQKTYLYFCLKYLLTCDR